MLFRIPNAHVDDPNQASVELLFPSAWILEADEKELPATLVNKEGLLLPELDLSEAVLPYPPLPIKPTRAQIAEMFPEIEWENVSEKAAMSVGICT